jgi:hypothetical protein
MIGTRKYLNFALYSKLTIRKKKLIMPRRKKKKNKGKLKRIICYCVCLTHRQSFVTLRSLLSGPVIDCMAKPDGRLVKGPVEDFSAEDRARQDDEESDCLGGSRGEAGRDVAVEEDFDAGGVHEESRDEVVTYYTPISRDPRKREGKRENLLNARLPTSLNGLLPRIF